MEIRKNNEGHYTFNDKIYVDARLRNVKDAEKYEFADFITVYRIFKICANMAFS